MPTERGKDYKVLCPFYQFCDKFSVTCESAITNAKNVRTLFRSSHALSQHMDNYCFKSFRYCEIYNAVMDAKYRDEGLHDDCAKIARVQLPPEKNYTRAINCASECASECTSEGAK